MARYHHGKIQFKWCDHCGTLILGDGCDRCDSAGNAFLVSAPGDIRPAMGQSERMLCSILEKHFLAGNKVEGKQVFLNKVAGEDRTDEVVLGGKVIGVLRFDLKRNDLLFDLRLEGANLIGKDAKRGLLIAKHQTGHMKGKNLVGSDILEIRGDFEADDPLIVLVGSMICAGVAKTSSSKISSLEKVVHIREVGKLAPWKPLGGSWTHFVSANRMHLTSLESKAVSDVKSFISNNKLPVTLSFSGGKDSLACYGIVRRAFKDFTMLFIDTGLEFPETVAYVHAFARKNHVKLLVADAATTFWEQVDTFGPPAKDFRWCCKVCKLAPLTDLIGRNFPGGTISVEGNRALESFARAETSFVESNPFVPNQTVLNPIRDWIAAEVWGYIWWKGLDYNPLYDEDFERIGCYLCPSCLASEWKGTQAIHPDLHRRWTDYLEKWSKANGVGKDFVRYGFWRWKVLPAKMRRLAEEIDFQVPRQRSDRMRLALVKGLSPCATGGYSVEGVVFVPSKRAFSKVAEVLKTVGRTRYSDEYEIALTKAGDSTVKVFGGGQVVGTGPTPEKAERVFESGVKAYLRAQMCTLCGICVKNCKRQAIALKDGPLVDEERCSQCGKCTEACVVAHYFDKLVTSEGTKA